MADRDFRSLLVEVAGPPVDVARFMLAMGLALDGAIGSMDTVDGLCCLRWVGPDAMLVRRAVRGPRRPRRRDGYRD